MKKVINVITSRLVLFAGVALIGASVLLAQTGGILQSQTMPSISLTATSNQQTIGAASHTTVLSFTAPAAASQTLTFPDPGGADSVTYLAKAQTLTTKTLTAPIVNGLVTGTYTLAGTPSLAGAGAGVATLAYGNSASSRTYTFPDAGAAANVGLFANTPAAIQTYPQTVYANNGYTNATTTFSNITGLSFAVAASTNYHATCWLTWNPGGATTVGPKYIWTGPASPTAVTAHGLLAKTVTTTSNLSVGVASFATTLDDAVAVTASITQTDVISIGLINGVNAGTVQLQAALHSASGTYTLMNGSYCVVQ